MATAWRRVITRRRAGEGASGVCCIRSSPSRPPPRLRGLRRRGLLPLVVEDDAARFQRLRFGELEFQPLRAFLEQGISAAEDDWSHAKAVFVDQASPCQRCGEIGAAEDEQVLAELPFQLGDLLLCVTFHEPRIVPLGLFHRSREDDLGDAVHEIGDFAFLLRPKRRHALVGHTTEEQHADRLRLLGGEPLQLLAPNRVMPIDVPALPTLEEAVEGDEIPHDEFSQASHASFVGQRVSILDVAARPRPSPIGRVVVSHGLCFGDARRLSSSYEMAPSSQPSYVPRSSNSIEARFSSPIAAYEALGPRLTLATPSFSSSAMGGRPFRTMTLIGNRSARTNAAIDSAAVRPIG